jgi:geranylgeranyl diphosphate synthase type I
MDSGLTLQAYFDRYVPRVEEEMRRIINDHPFQPFTDSVLTIAQPKVFNTMLNYHLGFADLDGSPAQVYSGKRIRPILTLLACEACNGQIDSALPAAAAVELLHNFSLIHDDIEDRDELRRGRPTLWRLWGEAQAINTGDAMFALAHTAITQTAACGVAAALVLNALRTFDDAAAALTIGQHLDLSFEARADVSVAEYRGMIHGKTGALTQAACAIGAIIAGADLARIHALSCFGAWLGIAFQLQDDVLGIWGDPSLTGKRDSDLTHGKKTLPVLYTAERDERVRELYFRQKMRSDADLREIKQRIDDSGARAYTEQAAHEAYQQALAGLAEANIAGSAAGALGELARSLLGRAA